MTAVAVDVERAVEESKLLLAGAHAREAKTDELFVWRVADLAARFTRDGRGNPKKNLVGEMFSAEEWAEKIDWKLYGKSVRYLQGVITEARAWPKELRVKGRTIEQHKDARGAHDNVEAASTWLASLGTQSNVRDRARNIGEITGSGPVYDATLKLIRARKEIVAVPAKLAGSGILGNEANFPQFRRELERLKNAVIHLDNYLAAETVVDTDALDAALAKILAGEEV